MILKNTIGTGTNGSNIIWAAIRRYFEQYVSIEVNISQVRDHCEVWFHQNFTHFRQSLCAQSALGEFQHYNEVFEGIGLLKGWYETFLSHILLYFPKFLAQYLEIQTWQNTFNYFIQRLHYRWTLWLIRNFHLFRFPKYFPSHVLYL